MKNKGFISIMISAVAALLLMGCSDYDNGYTEDRITFNKNFETLYGEIDPEQDWNVATRGVVTVTAGNSSEIKVYAINHGTYTLAGCFSGVTGTQLLSFDLQKGASGIVVSDGVKAFRAKDGGIVSFAETNEAETRAANCNRNQYESEGWNIPSPITQQELNDVLAVFNQKRENEVNTICIDCKDYFVQQVYKGTAVVEDANGTEFVASDKMNELKAAYNKQVNVLSWYPYEEELVDCDTKYAEVNDFNNGTCSDATGYVLMLNMYYDSASRQFTYSNSNDGVGAGGENSHYEYIVKEIDGAYYVGFDFCSYRQQSANDNQDVERDWIFNDWIVKIVPAVKDAGEAAAVPVTCQAIEEAEDPAWILACEDFGGSASDIDYNDVVFLIEHTSGQTKATVTPVAAGGTLASYIYYNDQCLGEIHQLMGSAPKISGAYTPLNVGGVTSEFAQSKYITVPSDFTMANANGGNMGGFSVKVLPYGTEACGSNPTASALESVTTVTAPGLGETPAMICVPATYILYDDPASGAKTTYDWAWPQERVRIDAVYEEFTTWVADKNNCESWFKKPKNKGGYCRAYPSYAAAHSHSSSQSDAVPVVASTEGVVACMTDEEVEASEQEAVSDDDGGGSIGEGDADNGADDEAGEGDADNGADDEAGDDPDEEADEWSCLYGKRATTETPSESWGNKYPYSVKTSTLVGASKLYMVYTGANWAKANVMGLKYGESVNQYNNQHWYDYTALMSEAMATYVQGTSTVAAHHVLEVNLTSDMISSYDYIHFAPYSDGTVLGVFYK